MTGTPACRRIVVGVDGSLPSLFGLRWASREARLRGAEIHAVIVDAEAATPCAPYAPVRPESYRADRWAAVGRTLVESIRTALGPCPEVSVREYMEAGRPPQVLARHSEGADLLVLGSWRGSGASTALGPTVRGCVLAASCPVVVIHQDDLRGMDPELGSAYSVGAVPSPAP